jgi:hypothetical protein
MSRTPISICSSYDDEKPKKLIIGNLKLLAANVLFPRHDVTR